MNTDKQVGAKKETKEQAIQTVDGELDRLCDEYIKCLDVSLQDKQDIEDLEEENKRLQQQIRKLEGDIESLHKLYTTRGGEGGAYEMFGERILNLFQPDKIKTAETVDVAVGSAETIDPTLDEIPDFGDDNEDAKSGGGFSC